MLPNDFLATVNFVFDPLNLTHTKPIIEPESSEYGAYEFNLNELFVKFRIAKTTPTKAGQFVTLWKRSAEGPIAPFDIADPIDLYIVSTRFNNHFGQFVFPKTVLVEQGVLSKAGQGGKRAMRVYTPWDKDLNRQAQKTQHWQLNYFLEIAENGSIDLARAHQLYQAI